MPKCDICNSGFKVLYRDQDYNCKDCLCEKCYTDTWGELPEPDDWNYPEELKETKPKKKIKFIKFIKKPASMGLRLKLVKVWFDKTYKDWWPWNMCLDMCEEDFGISINAESNPDISDYLYTLYKEKQPDSSDEEEEEKEVIYYFLKDNELTQTDTPFNPKIHEWETLLEVDGRIEKTYKLKGTDEGGNCVEEEEEELPATYPVKVQFSMCDGEEGSTDIFYVPTEITDRDEVIEYLEDVECCSIDNIGLLNGEG
jgi:hypothetical protein